MPAQTLPTEVAIGSRVGASPIARQSPVVVHPFSPPRLNMFNLTFSKISLDMNNRMLRAGLGKHEGKWFVRVDLWVVGLRISEKE